MACRRGRGASITGGRAASRGGRGGSAGRGRKAGEKSAGKRGAEALGGGQGSADTPAAQRRRWDATMRARVRHDSCGMCGVKAQDSEWHEVDEEGRACGFFCKRCGETYTMAYAYLSAAECVEKKNNDPDFGVCFLRSRDVKEGRARSDAQPTGVSSNTECGWTLQKDYKALTKTAFKQMCGFLPEELGVKPVELTDEHGDAFGAYLIEIQADEAKRTLSVWFKKSFQSEAWTQRPEQTLHSGQAEENFRHLTVDPKAALLRKLAKSAKDEDLQKKAEDLRLSEAGPHGGDGLEFGDLTEGNLAAMEAATSEGGGGATTALPGTPRTPSAAFRSPGKLDELSASAMTRKGSVIDMGCGGSVLDRASAAGGEDEWAHLGPARTVEDHISRLPLFRIMAGRKPGREERWARSFALGNTPDLAPLQQHLKAVAAAKLLQCGGVRKVSDEVLAANLSILVDSGEEIPSNMKLELLHRAVEKWSGQAGRFDKIGALLDMIEPWREISPDGTVQSRPFDPRHPMNRDLDGSDLEKIAFFREAFVNILVSCIRAGPEEESNVKALCETSLNRWLAVDDIDEAFGELVADLFVITRSILSLVAGDFVGGGSESDLQALQVASRTQTSKNMAGLIAIALNESAHWAEVQANFARFAAPTREHGPEIKVATEALVGGSAGAGDIEKYMKLYTRLDGVVRPSMTWAFKDQLVASVNLCMEGVSAQMKAGSMTNSQADEARSLVLLAQKTMGHDAKYSQLLGELREYEEKSKDTAVVAELSAKAEAARIQLEAFGMIEDSHLSALEDAATKAKGRDFAKHCGHVAAFLADLLQHIFEKGVEAALQYRSVLMLLDCFGCSVQSVRVGDNDIPLTDLAKVLCMTVGIMDSEDALKKNMGKLDNLELTVISGLYVQLEQLKQALPKELGNDSGVAFFGLLLNGAEKTLEVVKAKQMDGSAVALKDLSATLESIGGGGAVNEVWYKSFGGPSIKELIDFSQDTLMKFDGPALKSAVNASVKEVAKLHRLAETHGTKADEAEDRKTLLENVDMGLKRARATLSEAYILEVFRTMSANPVKMKSAARAQQSKAKSEGFESVLHPLVKESIDLAIQFKLKVQ